MCQDVELKGDITIGAGKRKKKTVSYVTNVVRNAGTVVHPKATIFAIAGPIVIGQGCIIEEGAIIVNRFGRHLNLPAKSNTINVYKAKRGNANRGRQLVRDRMS